MDPTGDPMRWLALLPALLAGTAHADPCERFELAPLAVGMRESAIDRPRAACTADRVAGGLRVQALIDTPEFYGTLAASLQLEGSLVWRGFELSALARAVDYRFAQNAVVTADEVSFGPLQLGVAAAVGFRAWGRPTVAMPFLRIDLPATDTGYSVTTMSIAAGDVFTTELGPRLHLHQRFSVLFWAAGPIDDPTTNWAGLGSADLGWSARGWLALLGGVELQAGWHGLLDHALLRVGTRIRRCLGTFEIGAAIPLLGEERTDAVVQLGFARRL